MPRRHPSCTHFYRRLEHRSPGVTRVHAPPASGLGSAFAIISATTAVEVPKIPYQISLDSFVLKSRDLNYKLVTISSPACAYPFPIRR